MTKKQKKIIAAISGFIILMGIALGIYVAKEYEENKVSAHPTSVITLDPGGTNEFEVPVDATSLVEPALISASPTYDDYVQSSNMSMGLLKDKLSSVSSMVQDRVMPLSFYELSDGKILFVIQSRNDTDYVNGYTPIFRYTQSIALVDSDGTLLDVREVATGNAFDTTTTGASNAIGDAAYSLTNIIELSNGSFDYHYYGFISSDLVNRNRVLNFKVTGNSLSSFSWQNEGADTYANERKYTLNALGDTGGDLYSWGTSNGTAHHGLWKWNNGTSYFDLDVVLQVPNKASYVNTSGALSYSTLSEVGINSVHGGYYGRVVVHSSYISPTGVIGNTDYLFFWDSTGQVTNTIYMGTLSNTSGLLNYLISSEMSSDTEIYYQKIYADRVEMVRKDLTQGYSHEEVLMTLPSDSTIYIQEANSTLAEYIIWGQNNGTGGDLASQGIGVGSVYIGYLDSSYSILNVQEISVASGTVDLSLLAPLSSGYYLVGGTGTSRDFTDAPSDGWKTAPSGWTLTNYNALFGLVELLEDYSPIIEGNNGTIDITDTVNLETNLLNLANVYDTYDFDAANITGQKDMSWLRKRLNRNPLELVYAADGYTLLSAGPISWDKLGFNATVTGPQQITYFITDGSRQASSTSVWINKITPETVIKNDYALDAQNFALPLTDVATDIASVNDFKELAKTMAWDMDSHVIDEDGAAGTFDSKVTVDTTQLATLQAATEAKPYPVDVTYKPDASTTIVNRVWVFVTTKNTKVDTANGIIIYADDYTLPLHLAQTETMADVYTRSDVKVYDYYDTNHETTTPLSTLADKTTTTGLTVTNLSVITGATGSIVVQPSIQYTSSSGTTVATPDVTITAQVLMHVRQVVFSSTTGDLAELVIPSEGYLQLVNTSTRQLNLVVDSGEESTNPTFKEVYTELDDAGGNDKLDFDVIVPEYYEYMGYVVTNTAGGHSSTLLTAGTYQYDLTSGNYEQWITVYVTPKLGTDGSPKPYAWDYKLNDFGTIDAD